MIAIWLYYVKGVNFIALLYVVFLVLASQGLLAWLRIVRAQRMDSSGNMLSNA